MRRELRHPSIPRLFLVNLKSILLIGVVACKKVHCLLCRELALTKVPKAQYSGDRRSLRDSKKTWRKLEEIQRRVQKMRRIGLQEMAIFSVPRVPTLVIR